MPATNQPNDNKKNEDTNKDATVEGGDKYTGDDTVVGDSDRLGGEKSLAPPPTPFVQYGGRGKVTGDGFRRSGPFREKYQCPSKRFSNLVSIPFNRVG